MQEGLPAMAPQAWEQKCKPPILFYLPFFGKSLATIQDDAKILSQNMSVFYQRYQSVIIES